MKQISINKTKKPSYLYKQQEGEYERDLVCSFFELQHSSHWQDNYCFQLIMSILLVILQCLQFYLSQQVET